MPTAKLFSNGRSQALRLPAEFRFEGDEVSIRRDPATGPIRGEVASHESCLVGSPPPGR